MTQGKLFDFTPRGEGRENITPIIHPGFADAEDVPRLANHNLMLLDALRSRGRLVKSEIRSIIGSLNETARISNVRAYLNRTSNETIKCHRGAGGMTWYTIEPLTPEDK